MGKKGLKSAAIAPEAAPPMKQPQWVIPRMLRAAIEEVQKSKKFDMNMRDGTYSCAQQKSKRMKMTDALGLFVLIFMLFLSALFNNVTEMMSP